MLLIFLVWISLLPEFQILLIPITILTLYFIFLKPDHYLLFILLMYLVVVGEINPILRVFVHLLGSASLLIFLFLHKEIVGNIYSTIDKRIKKFLLYFFSIVLLSAIFSQIPLKGIEIIFKELYFFFIVFSFYVYLYLKKNTFQIIIVLMISGLIMSLSSIFNLKDTNLIDLLMKGSASFRTGGLLSNVNALSGYIVVVFPLFIFYFFIKNSKIIKILVLLGLTVLMLGVLATISRSAGLSIIIGLLFFTYIINKRAALWILLSVLIVVLLLLILPTSEMILSALRIEQGFSQRDLLWKLSIDMFKDNWFLGVGPGLWGLQMFNYSPVLQDSFIGYLFYDVNVITGGFNNSHNYYLVFMSDLGIFGLFLSLYLPFTFFSIAKENLKLSKLYSNESYLLNLALTTVGVSIFIRAFFEGISIITFGWVAIDLPFWVVFAILIYNNQFLKKSKEFILS
ncbi:O-antigen ligase family protein [Ignavibacterium album]|uniref:O-antigen ligase family protein n=1 Tax=Ignavibacterium album TaxID=591197 RepID=UPI00143A0D3F|nr:O-antigen ligase family protein [Ignavibacterium album]